MTHERDHMRGGEGQLATAGEREIWILEENKGRWELE